MATSVPAQADLRTGNGNGCLCPSCLPDGEWQRVPLPKLPSGREMATGASAELPSGRETATGVSANLPSGRSTATGVSVKCPSGRELATGASAERHQVRSPRAEDRSALGDRGLPLGDLQVVRLELLHRRGLCEGRGDLSCPPIVASANTTTSWSSRDAQETASSTSRTVLKSRPVQSQPPQPAGLS